ncbi:MAG: ATP-binding cassette domain-containing protein [Trueperaceae bacterium]|nr:ATP-binding cassette domain-containing protein [Trueperaceae bacterium]
MITLELDHVTKRYGRTLAVDDLSFTVEPGRVTGFLGPNGSGKSTTMKMLTGLATPTSGRATIGGRHYRDLDAPSRRVGVILEANAFHPQRSGLDHLRALADALAVPRRRVDETLELVGLTKAAQRRVGGYSLGMRGRLGLAAAILPEPDVLILDEPANGLDPEGSRWLRDLLRSRADEGHTVFISSHLLAEMEHLVDEVVVLDRGRLVTTGTIAELRQVDTIVRTPTPEALVPILERAGGVVEVHGDGSLRVRGLATAEIGERALASQIVLHELATHTGSLEDLFIGWTGTTPTSTAADDRRSEPTKEEEVFA